MADYTTYAEISDRINTISQYVPTGETEATWVADMIEDAEDEINGRLAHLYTVPFSSPYPVIITTICKYFAISRVMNPGFVGEVPADNRVVDTYYKRGNDLLEKLEAGEITIPNVTVPNNAKAVSSTEDYDKVFTTTKYIDETQTGDTGTMEDW